MSKHLQILAAKGPLRRIYKCLLINSIQGSAEVINFVAIFESHAEAVLLRTSVRVSFMDYAKKGAVFNMLFADCVFVADNSPQATRLGIATKDQFLFLKCDSSFTLVCP